MTNPDPNGHWGTRAEVQFALVALALASLASLSS